jgi:excisionase family DNA binding protein
MRSTERLDGITAPPRYRVLRDMYAETAADIRAASEVGSAEVPQLATVTQSDALDLIDTKEAAKMLKLSDRQIRNLADAIGVRRLGRRFLFDRAAVEAYAHRRQEAAS